MKEVNIEIFKKDLEVLSSKNDKYGFVMHYFDRVKNVSAICTSIGCRKNEYTGNYIVELLSTCVSIYGTEYRMLPGTQFDVSLIKEYMFSNEEKSMKIKLIDDTTINISKIVDITDLD